MFTLVTFTCADTVEDEYLATLGRIAQQRIRTTDDVGMLGPHCIGVVLPETSAGGAWRVADDICSKLPSNKPRPQCDVYVHPAGRITSHEDQQKPSERRNGDRTEHNGGELAPVGADDDDPRAAQAIQFFFEQSMPGWKRAIDLVTSVTATRCPVAFVSGDRNRDQGSFAWPCFLYADARRVGGASLQDL